MSNIRVGVALLLLLAPCLLVSGCGDTQGKPLSKDETKLLHAPPGQPMPAEAAADIAKMQQQDAARRGADGPPPGAGAPVPPPAAAKAPK